MLRTIAASCELPPCSSASTTSPSGIERAPTARLSSAAKREDRERERRARRCGSGGRRGAQGVGRDASAHQLGHPNSDADALLGCPNYAPEAPSSTLLSVRPRARRLRLRATTASPSAQRRAGQRRAGAFPVTIDHKYGSTTIEAEPKRVVVVGLREQDALLALGVVPVATTEWYGKHPGAIFPWAKDELGDAKVPTVLTTDRRHRDREDRRAAARPDPRRLLRADQEGVRRRSRSSPRSSRSPRARSTTAPPGRRRR